MNHRWAIGCGEWWRWSRGGCGFLSGSQCLVYRNWILICLLDWIWLLALRITSTCSMEWWRRMGGSGGTYLSSRIVSARCFHVHTVIVVGAYERARFGQTDYNKMLASTHQNTNYQWVPNPWWSQRNAAVNGGLGVTCTAGGQTTNSTKHLVSYHKSKISFVISLS